MKQYQFIIPDLRDSDGKPHDPEHWENLASDLLGIAGGFTTDDAVGYWRNDTGDIIRDQGRRFTVAIEPDYLDDLTNIVADCLTDFDQQCIYFVNPDGTALLI